MAEQGCVDGWRGEAGCTHDEPLEDERSGGSVWLVAVVMMDGASEVVVDCYGGLTL
jgi:hypothetical protein